MGKIYRGYRRDNHCTVTVFDPERDEIQHALPHCYEIRNHSPAGFEWGYGGSGPAQLALALLVDALGSVRQAELSYQKFKWACVGHLPKDGWELSQDDIVAIVKAMVPNGNP